MTGFAPGSDALSPVVSIHIFHGLLVDTLKTFVEAEGNFSPGYATYGIYFWVYDPAAKKLTAPTMDGVTCVFEVAQLAVRPTCSQGRPTRCGRDRRVGADGVKPETKKVIARRSFVVL